MFVFIIASQNDITNYLDKVPRIFSSEAISIYMKKYQDKPHYIENLLSVRNALLLYKALKNERIRELNICVDGFEKFKSKYPFFCKFRTSFLYPKK